jgi:flavin-dependent dehydrogenase
VQRGYAFRVIRRAEFDAWLAGKARRQGITLREATTVRAVQPTAEGVRVETDSGFLTTRVVVGADGSTGVVRRVVQRGDRNHTARLLEIVTVPRPERSFHTQSDSYFDFRFVPQGIQGYTWDFPALDAGRAMRVRGIFDSRAAPAPSEIPLQQALAQEFQLHGYRMDDYRLEGFPLHWFDPRSPLACPGILLVGDAAGSDALFGEGISIALGYGKIAAAALVDAFSRGDFSFRSYRSAVLHSGMGRSLSRRTWFARFFYRLRWPPIQRLVWHWLGWLVTFIMNHFMINWAARQDKLSGQRKIIPSG